MKLIGYCLLGTLLVSLNVACAPSAIKTEEIEIKVADPLKEVKSILENYSKGQPLGSEVTSFPALVNTVKAVSQEKAEILEKGFAELQKPKANVKAIAKELLAKISS